MNEHESMRRNVWWGTVKAFVSKEDNHFSSENITRFASDILKAFDDKFYDEELDRRGRKR